MKRSMGQFAIALVVGWAAWIAPALSQAPGSGSDAILGETTAGDVHFTAGLRLWATKWEIASTTRRLVVRNPANPASAVFQDSQQKAVSDFTFVPIPAVGVRYGNFVGSASYFPKTAYDSKGTLNGDVRRDELDLNVGYHVLPQVVVSLGYKRGTQDKISPQRDGGAKVQGGLLGVSAITPLTERLSLYGNAAYGIGRAKSDIADAAGATSLSASYRIGEIGFAYRIIERLSLTFGYRAQVLTFNDFGNGTCRDAACNDPIAVRKTDFQSTTDGFVFGIVGVF